MVLGSANASMQGFGRHAETYINTVLAGEMNNKILEYFDELNNRRICKKINLNFSNIVSIWLPELKKVDSKTVGQFDAWVRRGVLCHKYERDQNYAKLRLTLNKPI